MREGRAVKMLLAGKMNRKLNIAEIRVYSAYGMLFYRMLFKKSYFAHKSARHHDMNHSLYSLCIVS